MNKTPPEHLVQRWFFAWLLLFMAYLAAVWSRWPRGPGTMGLHILLVAICFIPAVIAAIADARVTFNTFRALPWPMRVLGFIPLTCTALVFFCGPPEFD